MRPIPVAGLGALGEALFSIEAAKDKLRSKGVRVLNPPEAALQALTAGCLDGTRDVGWVGIDPSDSIGLRIVLLPRGSPSKPK